MTRSEQERFADIMAAIDRLTDVADRLNQGPDS